MVLFRGVLAIALTLLTTESLGKTPSSPTGAVDLTRIHAALTLDIADDAVSIAGEATLTATATAARTWALDAVDFASVEVKSTPAARWRYDGSRIVGEWSEPVTGAITARITYRVAPTRGIARGPDAVWTAFHTWHWLPVDVDPAERATLDLKVDAPDGWTVIATGDGPDRPGPDVASSVAHPSYTYGFFAGVIASGRDAGPLSIWGAGAATGRVLERTRAAIARWTARFGTPWAVPRYVQVFVPGRAAQELAGMAFISRSYLDAVVADPTEDWLIVHELAHQAWGNRVTCATWGDFWLNEAIVVWWVARDKLLRGQPAAYDRELRLWAKRVERASKRGDDRRIARPGVGHANAGGSVVYHAGALLVHDLVDAIGVDAFEAGMRRFIARDQGAGVSLTTAEFLSALPLDAAQRAAVACRLRDAGGVCPTLSPAAP